MAVVTNTKIPLISSLTIINFFFFNALLRLLRRDCLTYRAILRASLQAEETLPHFSFQHQRHDEVARLANEGGEGDASVTGKRLIEEALKRQTH